ncbi:uncharacterized protein LOC107013227 [Solanum pennellii]|uniref:Uncharacterized protein LOC107013227 n=1 Tax=Solanum pennellii TaxID=28526 RepID=A0ABM1GBI1_SOLPN|nr:uncharacterized protein LOC107013227 [Solanum pennellii]
MKWSVWNVRGMNKRYKHKEIRLLLQQNKTSLAGLIETRVKETNSKATLKAIAPGWKIIHNYKESANGRIWIVWDGSWYDIKLIRSSAQMVHCQVNERSKGYQFNLTVVYGYNTLEMRRSLWTELKMVAHSVSEPWLIIGDFNAILSPQDRLAGVPVTLNEIKDFEECVKDMGITEVGNARIASRIDRAFGNDCWMDKWGHAILEYGNPGVSDHSTMHLLLHQSYHQIRVSFKFFNVWIEHESFMELVDTIWKQEYGSEVMRGIWYKLKALQPVLRQLNKREFQYIGQKIEKARSELEDLQEKLYNQAQDDLVIKEKELL